MKKRFDLLGREIRPAAPVNLKEIHAKVRASLETARAQQNARLVSYLEQRLRQTGGAE